MADDSIADGLARDPGVSASVASTAMAAPIPSDRRFRLGARRTAEHRPRPRG